MRFKNVLKSRSLIDFGRFDVDALALAELEGIRDMSVLAGPGS
jgi:hypothetical protein